MSRFTNLIILYLLLPITPSFAWGFLCHQHINRQAVFALPPEMFGFYKQNILYLTANAVNPDKRRYIVPNEAPKHFIDLDYYKDSTFRTSKPSWYTALKYFPEDTLQKHGTLPWNILLLKKELTEAFIAKDLERILKLSADVGHYLADAHVPLHCTQNYNGQFTNQTGIHALWESRVPERYLQEFSYWEITHIYINNWNEEIWSTILASYALVNVVLQAEKQTSNQYTEDEKYEIDLRGNKNIKTYSKAFTTTYHQKLHGMVEQRMRQSIQTVANFWYTCWIDAGQPQLGSIDLAITEQPQQNDKIPAENHLEQPHDCEGGH